MTTCEIPNRVVGKPSGAGSRPYRTKSMEKICENCGCDFTVSSSGNSKRWRDKRFCSPKCVQAKLIDDNLASKQKEKRGQEEYTRDSEAGLYRLPGSVKMHPDLSFATMLNVFMDIHAREDYLPEYLADIISFEPGRLSQPEQTNRVLFSPKPRKNAKVKPDADIKLPAPHVCDPAQLRTCARCRTKYCSACKEDVHTECRAMQRAA